MNLKQTFTLLASFLIFLSSCSKTTVVVDYGRHSGTDTLGDHRGTSLVTFHAAIENRIATRAVTLMQSGILSQLFAFDGLTTQNAQVSPYAQGVYITSAPGVLAGYSGYKMYLPNGVFDFYGVSDNLSSTPLPLRFVSGKSEPLFNGVDYLWWHAPRQDVSGTQVTVPVVYRHAASQIVFEVSEGEGLKLDKLTSATITPPAPGAQMNLLTGEIPYATAYDTQLNKLGVNGLRAQVILLPFKNNAPMQLTLGVVLQGEIAPRTYQVQVPLPDGILKPGNSYLFSVIVNANTVTFADVVIKDWTEVDQTGNPLYPK